MRILIIRHGIAEQVVAKAKVRENTQRELTKTGRQKMQKAVKGLLKVVPEINVVATALVPRLANGGHRFRSLRRREGPSNRRTCRRKPPAQLLEWLNAHPTDATIALVGHEPHLGTFLCWLLTGLQESFVVLKKGGAAMVDVASPVTAGRENFFGC